MPVSMTLALAAATLTGLLHAACSFAIAVAFPLSIAVSLAVVTFSVAILIHEVLSLACFPAGFEIVAYTVVVLIREAAL